MLCRVGHGKEDDFSNDHILGTFIAIEAKVPHNQGDVNKGYKEGECCFVKISVPVGQNHAQQEELWHSLHNQDCPCQKVIFSSSFKFIQSKIPHTNGNKKKLLTLKKCYNQGNCCKEAVSASCHPQHKVVTFIV